MAKNQTTAPIKSTAKNASVPWLRHDLLWVAAAQFLLVGAYVLTTVIYDSWNLLPHDAVSQRWSAACVLIGISIIVWFATKSLRTSNDLYYRGMLYALVVADIIFASYNVFWERGMASKSVMLFAVPILVAAVARSRAALVATATLCVAAYSSATVRYFTLHYGEGFRVQLYGEILFYSALMFVFVAILAVLLRPSSSE